MYIFIIIIIYEFPSNGSFLLTRGMGRGGGGGQRHPTPGTCRAGLGQCPLRTFLTLFNLSTKNKWCFTFFVWLQLSHRVNGMWLQGNGKGEGVLLSDVSMRWGLVFFIK